MSIPIIQLAINGTIYPELIDITTNAQQATQVQVGESLFATWFMTGPDSIQSVLSLQNTTVATSWLFANNNWVNNVLATVLVVRGTSPRLTLSGATLGRILPGKWNELAADEVFGETLTLQLQLQTPLTLFAPKVIATFY